MAAGEDVIVCSDYWYSQPECESRNNCKFISDPTNSGNTFCVPDCETINGLETERENTCKQYAGCTWDGAECNLCEADSYCPGNNQEIECGAGTGENSEYDKSLAGADSATLCYKSCTGDATTCGIAAPGHMALEGNIVCKTTYGDNPPVMLPSQLYHTEGNGCYLNTRPCNLFPARDSVGSNINTQNDITGNATWNDSYYTTNNCQYKTSVTNFENRSCTASVTYKPNATLTSATGTLVFSQLVSYYCTECTYDYFCPDPDTDYTSCTAYNNVKICSCKKIPRGNYRTVDWSAGTSPYNTYTACPIGQTTFNIYAGEYVGGESIDDCQYGDQTQLCDTAEPDCKTFQQLGLNPNEWHSLLQ